jgi:hypothetical protein
MMQLGVVKSGKGRKTALRRSRPGGPSAGWSPPPLRVRPPGGSSSSAGPSASDPRITPPSTTTPGAGANTGSGSEAIHLAGLAHSARPFQPGRIRGTYHGRANTFLRLQRWEEDKWLDFPVPTKTDQSGRSVISGISSIGFIGFFVFMLSMGIALLRRRSKVDGVGLASAQTPGWPSPAQTTA